MRTKKLPYFLQECGCNGNNMDTVCIQGVCSWYKECTEFFTPLAEDLERFQEIGEV